MELAEREQQWKDEWEEGQTGMEELGLAGLKQQWANGTENMGQDMTQMPQETSTATSSEIRTRLQEGHINDGIPFRQRLRDLKQKGTWIDTSAPESSLSAWFEALTEVVTDVDKGPPSYSRMAANRTSGMNRMNRNRNWT